MIKIQRQNHLFVDTQSWKMPSLPKLLLPRRSVGGSPVANKSFVCLVVSGNPQVQEVDGFVCQFCDPNLLGPVVGLIIRKTKQQRICDIWNISVESFDKLLMVVISSRCSPPWQRLEKNHKLHWRMLANLGWEIGLQQIQIVLYSQPKQTLQKNQTAKPPL